MAFCSQLSLPRVHEELKEVHERDCKVFAGRQSQTESEVACVFVVELSLDHDRDVHRRKHLVGIRREAFLFERFEMQLAGSLDLVRCRPEYFQVERPLEEVCDLVEHLGDGDM